MRKLIPSLLCLTLLITNCYAQNIPSYVPKNGLVAWYPFTGNANDSSGNSNNGIVNGAVPTTDRFGNPNSAYIFNGSSDYISVPNSTTIDPTASISLSAWVLIDSSGTTNFQRIVSKKYLQAQDYSSYSLITGNAGYDSLGNCGLTLRTLLGTDSSGNPYTSYNWTGSHGSNILNKWVHICGTWDGVHMKFYQNGKLLITTPQAGTILYDSEDLWFGGGTGTGSTPFFKGGIDDIAIYNRALDSAEVAALFEAPNVPSDIPLNGMVAWYPFTGNAIDSSGHGNNGNVSGAVLTTDRFGKANSAYLFNGVSSYITVPNSTSLQNIDSSITISAWVFINAWFVDAGGGGSWFPILHKSNQQSQYGKYSFGLESNEILGHLDYQETGFTLNVQTGKWIHIVMTIAHDSTFFYINGSLVSASPSGIFPQIPVQNLPLLIGVDYPGLVEFANGKIDDIAIYNRALDSAEVAALYHEGGYGEGTLALNSINLSAMYNNSATTITWSAEAGLSTSEFLVQKSLNGTNFFDIDTTLAVGNGGNSYSYLDSSPTANGEIYYRIKGVDKDGSFIYSRVATAFVQNNKLFSISPNPAHGLVTINFYQPTPATFVNIYDARGAKIFMQSFNGPVTTFQLSTQLFPAGVYIVEAKTESTSYTQKILIIR